MEGTINRLICLKHFNIRNTLYELVDNVVNTELYLLQICETI